ncbi:MAG: stalk domain-containing protein [Caldisericia bacterium]
MENTTVKVNGEDAEVKRKFRHTVYLDKAPSITTANIEVRDKDGEVIKSFDFKLKNSLRKELSIYLGQKFAYFNGEKIIPAVVPQMIDGSAMIPVELITETFGIATNMTGNCILFSFQGSTTIITVGTPIYTHDGESYQMETSPVQIRHSVMIPISFILHAFGLKSKETDIEDYLITQETVPEPDEPQNDFPPEDVLKLDTPNPKIYNQTQYEIIGEIPSETFVSINSKESNIYHQFDHEVALNKEPSFIPIKVEVFDENGNILETKDIDYENCDYLNMRVWIDRDEMEVNGEMIKLDTPATILRDRTMIPFRAIADSFGATTEWVSETRTVVFIYGKTRIEMPISSPIVKIDNKESAINPPATIINGRTMVPLRFISYAFGAEVGYDANEKLVMIDKIIHPERE